MSMELVRKPASATTGGEITTDSGQQYPAVAKQWNIPTTGSHTWDKQYVANQADNHAIIVQRNGGAVQLAIGYSDDVIRMYVGTTTGHPLAFRTANTLAAVCDATQAWTFGPASSSAGLLHKFLGAASTGWTLTTGTVASSGPNGGAGTDTDFFPYFYCAGWASTGTSAHAQFVGNSNNRYWGMGCDNSNNMVIGTVAPSSGIITGIQALMSLNGAWTFGGTTASLGHTFRSGGNTTVNITATSAASVMSMTSSGGAGCRIDFQDGATAKSSLGHLNTVGRLQAQTGGTGGVELTSGATSWSSMSDERLKENIADLDYGLAQVVALNPISFNYLTDNESDPRRIGLSAQAVKLIMPEFVFGEGTGVDGDFYSLDLTNMVPVLVKAIQELKQQFDDYVAAHP